MEHGGTWWNWLFPISPSFHFFRRMFMIDHDCICLTNIQLVTTNRLIAACLVAPHDACRCWALPRRLQDAGEPPLPSFINPYPNDSQCTWDYNEHSSGKLESLKRPQLGCGLKCWTSLPIDFNNYSQKLKCLHISTFIQLCSTVERFYTISTLIQDIHHESISYIIILNHINMI